MEKEFVKYVVNNLEDIEQLLFDNVITHLHIKGMVNILKSHGQVVVNKNGGYCYPI